MRTFSRAPYLLILLGFSVIFASCRSLEPARKERSVAGEKTLCARLHSIEIHSHRGASDRPENTLVAFLRAADQGADFIEMDLQVSREGDLVVAHDAFVKESCQFPDAHPRTQRIYYRHLSTSDILKLHCGSGSKISTLKDILKELKDRVTPQGRRLGFNIEVKYNPKTPEFYPSREEYALTLSGVLNRSGLHEEQILVQSFDHEFLRILKMHRPQTAVAPLLSDARNGEIVALQLGAKLVTPHEGQVTADRLQRFHDAGIRVIPWTVNDPHQAKAFIKMGVDGLITDRAEWLALVRESCQ